jgi:uncharacterized protein (DUF302 family)
VQAATYRTVARQYMILHANVAHCSLEASHGVANRIQQTVERFENAVKAKGQIVFGRVDHAEAAAKYGIEFKPHTTVFFGRPQNGTPLMQKAGTYTVDAPHKVAVWQDEQGKVWLTFNSAEYFANHLLPRHGLTFSADQVKNLQQFMDQVTDQATK